MYCTRSRRNFCTRLFWEVRRKSSKNAEIKLWNNVYFLQKWEGYCVPSLVEFCCIRFIIKLEICPPTAPRHIKDRLGETPRQEQARSRSGPLYHSHCDMDKGVLHGRVDGDQAQVRLHLLHNRGPHQMAMNNTKPNIEHHLRGAQVLLVSKVIYLKEKTIMTMSNRQWQYRNTVVLDLAYCRALSKGKVKSII